MIGIEPSFSGVGCDRFAICALARVSCFQYQKGFINSLSVFLQSALFWKDQNKNEVFGLPLVKRLLCKT